MKNQIFPPTYFIALLVVSILFNLSFPTEKIIFPPYNYLGFILIILGGIINIWADMLFKKGKTTVKLNQKPSSLITLGPFALSRHPMYLGMTGILIGIAIIQATLISFIFPIIFVILMEIKFIKTEEKNLEEAFGEKYKEYKKKVRKWI